MDIQYILSIYTKCSLVIKRTWVYEIHTILQFRRFFKKNWSNPEEICHLFQWLEEFLIILRLFCKIFLCFSICFLLFLLNFIHKIIYHMLRLQSGKNRFFFFQELYNNSQQAKIYFAKPSSFVNFCI